MRWKGRFKLKGIYIHGQTAYRAGAESQPGTTGVVAENAGKCSVRPSDSCWVKPNHLQEVRGRDGQLRSLCLAGAAPGTATDSTNIKLQWVYETISHGITGPAAETAHVLHVWRVG